MNSRNLFYVRNIQIKLVFNNDKKMRSLFLLEKYLFESFNEKNEKFLISIKLKWFYDEIEKEIFSTKITNNLKELVKNGFKKDILQLVDNFHEIINCECNKNFMSEFESFNNKFNKIVHKIDNQFYTNLFFQVAYFFYKNKKIPKKTFKIPTNNKIDIFEKTFLVLFKNIIKKNNDKISKKRYLYQLIKEFIKNVFKT
tara:strand:- start:1240 stop:1833 length:594 start_codon:yes stop_codon:yes gene_type:complete